MAPGLGTFIYSIMPIAIAFHFSHYLPVLLINAQYAVIAMSDPFATGADLFGLGHMHVTTSFMATYEGTRMIWNLQTAGIVIGHVAAVVLAHALAVRHFGDNRKAVLSQLPLAVLMVLYTALGCGCCRRRWQPDALAPSRFSVAHQGREATTARAIAYALRS
jgi:hypothetical protein